MIIQEMKIAKKKSKSTKIAKQQTTDKVVDPLNDMEINKYVSESSKDVEVSAKSFTDECINQKASKPSTD